VFRGTRLVRSRHDITLTPEWVEIDRGEPREQQDLSELHDSPITCADCGRQVWGVREAITFLPEAGTVLMCDFTTGFRPPEIVKIRPVVVLSERSRNRETCIVVPTSKSQARDKDARTVKLERSRYGFLHEDSWAKCQCPYTISITRLYRMRGPDGRSIDSRATKISDEDLMSVRQGAAASLGLP
jgi:uncharacterized protein YifN (PemK superfamily)